MCIVSLVHASAYHFRSIEREHWEISYWCWSLKLSWMLRIIATAELGSSSCFTTTSTSLTAARNVPALFLWAGIYFVIISPWSNISTRRGYRYKIIIIWLRQFSLRIWRELVIGDGAVTLHNLVVVCFHIPAGVIFIRRHISTFSCRYYRYLHHCCVSRKHNSAQYTAWSCIVPIYRPLFVILILQWPGAPPTTICHRACNNLAGDICHRKAISSPASAACIQLPPAHRKLDLCTAPLHV